jgi:uncharacterized membrane protein (DUF2068 family)
VIRPLGLEAIIDYKLFKAAVELVLGILLAIALYRGPEAMAATFAQQVIDHVAGAWSLRAAAIIVRAGTSGHVALATAVALGDAVLSAVEGLALRAGKWWAAWLVVIATGALIPIEIYELVRRPRPIRGVILVLNWLILVYLLRQALREHRERVMATRQRVT